MTEIETRFDWTEDGDYAYVATTPDGHKLRIEQHRSGFWSGWIDGESVAKRRHSMGFMDGISALKAVEKQV